MKYAIIFYIALGLVLSLAIGIEYNCEGPEMFPIYYGSPFVFKEESLASSLEYFYSLSGLLANILVWCLPLFILNKFIKIITQKIKYPKLVIITYKIIIVFLIVFSTLSIALETLTLASGFDEDLNYWYWNFDNEAKIWGMTCKGEIIFIRLENLKLLKYFFN